LRRARKLLLAAQGRENAIDGDTINEMLDESSSGDKLIIPCILGYKTFTAAYRCRRIRLLMDIR